MSSTIDYSSTEPFAQTGRGIQFSSPPNVGMGYYINRFDFLFPKFLFENFYVPMGIESIGSIFGFFRKPLSKLVLSNKVEKYTDANGVYDSTNYRTFLFDVSKFIGILDGVPGIIPDSSRENFVRHKTTTGNFAPKLTLRPFDVGVSDLDVSTFPLRNFRTRCFSLHYYGNNDLRLIDSAHLSQVSVTDYFDALSEFGAVTKLIDGFYDIQSTISGFSWSQEASGVSIHYHVHVEYRAFHGQPPYTDDIDWDTHLYFPTGIPDVYVDPEIGGYYETIHVDHVAHAFITNIVDNDPSDGLPAVYDWESTAEMGFPILLSLPALGDLEVTKDGGYVVSQGLSKLLNNFSSAIDSRWYDVLSSSAFSSVAAFKQLEGSLSLNSLKDISKISELRELVPLFRDALTLLSDVANKDLSTSSISDLLDLLSAGYLTDKFGIEPTLKLVSLLPQFGIAFAAFGKQPKIASGRGSFRFEFPNKVFGRENVTLVTRTKIVMDTSPRGVLTSLLGLDAIGIVPKPSTIFSFVPFNFVLNWFTNVSESMKNVEYLVLLSGLPAYFVHTYTLSSPLTPQELDNLGMSGTSGVTPSLRVFRRDISRYSPFIRNDSFGFGLPQGFPSTGVLASLLYQLVFG